MGRLGCRQTCKPTRWCLHDSGAQQPRTTSCNTGTACSRSRNRLGRSGGERRSRRFREFARHARGPGSGQQKRRQATSNTVHQHHGQTTWKWPHRVPCDGRPFADFGCCLGCGGGFGLAVDATGT